MITITIHTTLPPEAAQIRQQVFIEEQGFQNEFDHIDYHAIHLLAKDDDTPVGTCRIYPDTDHPDQYHLGRMAVIPSHRKQHIGASLISAAETHLRNQHIRSLILSAQEHAIPFYQKLQFTPIGPIYLDENVPHQRMEKDLISPPPFLI